MAFNPHHLTCRCCAVAANNATALPRRPSTSLFSILVPVTLDGNTWTEVLISKGSWVLMQPRRGKRQHDGSIYKWAWKGRVLEFRIPQGKTTVKEVLVQHVYMHHQLVMAPGYETGLPTHRPNYIYPSSYEEWQPIECIVEVIHVLHGHVGKLQYEGRNGGSLADEGLFFYDHFYQLQDRCNTKGYLQALPLEAEKNRLAWPVPDCFAMEAIYSKLYRDVQRSLRPTIPTKLVRIMLSVPINSFVEMFGDFDVRTTKTMLASRRMDKELLAKLLRNQWFMRQVGKVHCRIVLDTVVAKYMIPTQTFILSFWYCREHYINGVLVPMDQEAASLEDNKVVDIEVVDEALSLLTIISIREECTLAELRKDMNDEAPNLLPLDFCFVHNRKRVLKRRESHIKCRELEGRVQAKT